MSVPIFLVVAIGFVVYFFGWELLYFATLGLARVAALLIVVPAQ